MKTKFIHIVLIIFYLSGFSQNWISFGNDTLSNYPGIASVRGLYCEGNKLYATGGFYYGGTNLLYGAGVWDTINWGKFDGGINNGGVCVTKYKGKLYFGGYFSNASGVANTDRIARWNGIQWESLPNSFGELGSAVNDMVVFRDTLILATNKPGTASRIAAYDADISDYVDIGSLPFASTYALEIYNGELYAGGSWNVLKKYVGGTGLAAWEDVGGHMSDLIRDMEVDTFNNFLYVGGGFIVVDDTILTDNVAIWNGFNWEKVGYGNGYQSSCLSIEFYNGDLYAGLSYDTIGGVFTDRLARWDGTAWQMVGGGVKWGVLALEEWQDRLYVGGEIDSVNGQPQKAIACWEMPLDTIECRYIKPRVFTLTDTFELAEGQVEVQFYNNNAYVDSWDWDFGDSGSDNIKDPSHIYTAIGDYNVQVTVTHNTCVETATKTIHVVLGDDIQEIVNIDFKIFPNPSQNNFTVQTFLPEGSKSELRITGLNGHAKTTIPIKSDKTEIYTSGWVKGTYLCNLFVDGKLVKSEKMILK
ncbi:MAG: hypothetical protein A2W91_20350 [Bacteroidetes bacterium GWF2_38_335]|nr:MAG: hypothetical protein A2W91_20350 [Bacteroidetes bacterium GWF2_38_335]OFY79488.1 MAG: hypothetical protein A2281_13735 [Bacteroidetes bacterium RIFOXYA12_FULL_38_20]HBS86574.1 hypothetical protein [Bacteroidales bacterium]